MNCQIYFPKKGLYAVTPENILRGSKTLQKIESVILGGAKVIQLRLKNEKIEGKALEKIIRIQRLCKKFSVTFIVNDDIKLARKIDADGVHLGEHDISYDSARRALGNNKIIGISCYNNLKKAVDAAEKGANYIALGSFYSSVTKKTATKCDLEILQQTSKKVKVPIVAIGGISAKNGHILIKNGASFLACVDAIFNKDDEYNLARKINLLFEQEKTDE